MILNIQLEKFTIFSKLLHFLEEISLFYVNFMSEEVVLSSLDDKL